MKIDCPNCGHHLGQLDVSSSAMPIVKEPFSQPSLSSHAPESLDPARHSFSEPDKARGYIKASAAQSTKRDLVTEQQRREIRQIFSQGYSVYFIKNQLELDLEPEEIRRIAEGLEG